ncbi:VOC family protein [Streptomyces sp. TRM 70351]|uniref:VOC family protein n=1 Tax=Streptomyces sp. TRM 70351 TaxID=3116552 RepID=UPI002E7B3913|nr:VOC family protein [Streptomyces sp. TRM 70351]MEE1926656.1 VOC family protein [Streptomyces sp. TRM 70351]
MSEGAPRPTPGTPSWVSLMVHDLAGSEKFYHELFGWEFEEGPQQLGPYVRARFGSRDVAGLGEMPGGRSFPVSWLPYLATDDADATCALVRDCGGTVGVGPIESGDGERVAIATDPCGAPFGICQAGAEAGARWDGRLGTPVWNELLTPNTFAVSPFYSRVFGYEPEPVVSSDLDYLTLNLNGRAIGGIRGTGGTVPRDRGPHWTTYFAVEDAERAARRVAELGGRLMREPRDSPYGRVAHVADPEGTPFAVIKMHDPQDVVTRRPR